MIYIKTNEDSVIVDAALVSVIDEGWQVNDASIDVFDPDGIVARIGGIGNFKLVDGVITHRSEEEIEADIALELERISTQTSTDPVVEQLERIEALEAAMRDIILGGE